MGNKRSSAKKLICVLCASLQSIVGTSLARDKRVNYRGTKFQFLNMGGMSVRGKKKESIWGDIIKKLAKHPFSLSVIAVGAGWSVAKGGELAWKRWIQPGCLKWFQFPKYYGYLYNCFNLAYGRISKIFAVCKKDSNLSSGIGTVLEKLCGEEDEKGEKGVYNSETGEINAKGNCKELKNVEMDDVSLDGALFLLSEAFSTGEMKNDEYYYDVIQNLKKIVPGCSEYDSYKSLSGEENLRSDKISSRRVVKDDGGLGGFARFAAGYGEFKQKLPFNPFPLIYLIRNYIAKKYLPKIEGKDFSRMVPCDCVNLSNSNSFVKDYSGFSNIKIGHDKEDEVKENYFSLSRTGDKLTIVFWLTDKLPDEDGKYTKDDGARRVECTYTVPGGKEILEFDKRWEKPKFVNAEPLKYNEDVRLFK